LEFKAGACVEVLDVPAFCARIEAALPANATFPGLPGRTRIGQRVEYYREAGQLGARWALRDRIAISKLQEYAWPDEFRLVFSLTDALGFEKVSVKVAPQTAPMPANPAVGFQNVGTPS
jgi:hypothetical protein